MKRSALPLVRGASGRMRLCARPRALRTRLKSRLRQAGPSSAMTRSTTMPSLANQARASSSKRTALSCFASGIRAVSASREAPPMATGKDLPADTVASAERPGREVDQCAGPFAPVAVDRTRRIERGDPAGATEHRTDGGDRPAGLMGDARAGEALAALCTPSHGRPSEAPGRWATVWQPQPNQPSPGGTTSIAATAIPWRAPRRSARAPSPPQHRPSVPRARTPRRPSGAARAPRRHR